MQSPFTGGETKLVKEWQTVEYRKDEFKVYYHSYLCIDTDQHFTDDRLDNLNMSQVYNQYRAKYGIPFPDEIKNIKDKYELSAAKMSDVLGFGANVYRNYENGEMPTVAHGRLIRMAEDSDEFVRMLYLSKNSLEPHEYDKVKKKIDQAQHNENAMKDHWQKLLFGNMLPEVYNGFKVPSIQKLGAIVRFFSKKNEPYTTAMNKLLFYADFGHFKNYGFGISGLSYKAITNGPVPINYGALYNKMENDGYALLEEVDFREFVGIKFVSGWNAGSETLLSEEEKDTLEKVSKRFSGCTTKEIIDISHMETAWKHNVNDFDKISYVYGFDLLHLE